MDQFEAHVIMMSEMMFLVACFAAWQKMRQPSRGSSLSCLCFVVVPVLRLVAVLFCLSCASVLVAPGCHVLSVAVVVLFDLGLF